MSISPETLANVEECLRRLSNYAHLEAKGIEETFYDTYYANRLRALVLDTQHIAKLLGLTDLIAHISTLQAEWPNTYFDDEGNPTDKEGNPINEDSNREDNPEHLE